MNYFRFSIRLFFQLYPRYPRIKFMAPFLTSILGTPGAGFICGLNFSASQRRLSCANNAFGSMFLPREWIISTIGNARTLVLGGSRNGAELSSCARSYFGTFQAVGYQTHPREMLFSFGDMCDCMKHLMTSCPLSNWVLF